MNPVRVYRERGQWRCAGWKLVGDGIFAKIGCYRQGWIDRRTPPSLLIASYNRVNPSTVTALSNGKVTSGATAMDMTPGRPVELVGCY